MSLPSASESTTTTPTATATPHPLLVDVCLSPELLPLYEMKGHIVVVVDIFRATSVMVTAMAQGAKAIQTFDSLESCQQYGRTTGAKTAAERDGVQVEGFDYGNSPFSYTPETIGDQMLAMTTTNGTKTLAAARKADTRAIGSFFNLSALADWLRLQGKPILIACAAWKGKPCVEDMLFAGALLEWLGADAHWANDSCLISHSLWLAAKADPLSFVAQTSHVQRLAKLGIEKDIAHCLQIDLYPIVLVADDQGKITKA